MTKTTILTLASLTGLLLVAVGAQTTFGAINILPIGDSLTRGSNIEAVPEWVNNNFVWYGEGLIEQTDLLNSLAYLLDNGYMHLSDKAAQEKQYLEAENQLLKTVLMDPEVVDEEAANHLRKAYDLNPNDLSTTSPGERIMQPEYGSGDKMADSTLGGTGEPTPFSCDGISCSCQGSDDCWDMMLTDSCHNDQLWCEDDDDGSYGCVCWESSAGDASGEYWFEDLRPANIQLGGNGEVIIVGGASAADEGTSTSTITYVGLEFGTNTIHELIHAGDATTAGWEEGVAAFTKKNFDSSVPQTSTAIHELLHGLGIMCNSAIDKEISIIAAEMEIIEETAQTTDSTTGSDSAYSDRLADGSTSETNEDKKYFLQKLQMAVDKLESIQTGVDVCDAEISKWEQKLSGIGDDAQLANIDLQNSLQKQQQSLQNMANESEVLHDTAMSIIRKLG